MTTTRKGEYTVHAAAAAFPMMAAAEIEELAAGILRDGLLHPIEICRGQIIDGRNRAEACRRANVAPRFVDLSEALPTDDAVVAHVIAANIHRRHLSVAQRASIAADLAELRRGANQHRKARGSNDRPTTSSAKEPPPNGGPSTAQAAKLLGVSTRSVERARALKRSDPAAHAAVKAGRAKPPPTKPKNTSAVASTRATSTKTPAPPPKSAASTTFVPPPPKPKPASAPAATRRETAPAWYVSFVDLVVVTARATMSANNVEAVEILEALDDAYGQLEDEAGGKRA